MKLQNHQAHKLHNNRPWGTYTVQLQERRGKTWCQSLQMHHHRSEHWIVERHGKGNQRQQ
ncbi:hypothetical protein EJG51_010180 [Undibacterium piscinae]|uniref:Uncharacterized protein n=1 Tax=Undibacterium piscinae TaxID=2495591 RepID=A0A6M4A468_9BURK|nr:hypothetical protein EJG51_010180 [Undibacterium piscinae]